MANNPPNKQSIASTLFEELDKDHDGKITREELQDGLRMMRLPYNEDVINTLLTQLDTDKNGVISVEEFENFANTKGTQIRQVFDTLDSDKDQYIDLREAEEIMRKLKVDESKVKQMWGRIDVNKDGRISYDEWHRMMLLSPYAQLHELMNFWSDAQALDQGDEGFAPVPTSRLKTAFGYLAAGAVAGVVSRTVTAPLERLKILFQVNTGKSPSLAEGMRTIYKDGGAKGLFRGNLANVLKVAPESGIKFFTYETMKEVLAMGGTREIGNAERFIAGATAGVVAHITTFPLEVIKTRIAAAPTGTYSGIADVVTKMMKYEGKVLPFYQGLSASLMSTIPHSGINMMVYEGLKQMAMTWNGGMEEPGPTILLASATVASVSGQMVGYPFHVAKARLIMQHKKAVPYNGTLVPTMDHYTGVWDVFRRVLKHEGPKGLFKGIVPSFLKSIPAHGITFLVYEYFKRTLNIDKQKKHH